MASVIDGESLIKIAFTIWEKSKHRKRNGPQ